MATVDTKITSKEKEFTLSIPVNSSRIIRVLGAIIVLLILIGVILKVYHLITGHFAYGLVDAFDLDREDNLPAYFSSILLLVAAGLLGIIAISKRSKHDTYSTYWLVLSIVFLCISIDESASLHELLIEPLRNAFHLSGFLYFSWVIVGFIFILIFAVVYLRFFLSLPSRTRYYFFISAVFLVVGAVGFELIGGRYISFHQEVDLTYVFMTAFEEFLEMVGILLFIKALLDYIEDNVSGVSFSFKNLRSIG